MMMKMLRVFAVRKEERRLAWVAVALIVLLNVLFIHRLSPFFMQEGFGPYLKAFFREFHLSGYDPLTYMGVTDWDTVYNVYRHPLLAFLIYPLYLLNAGLSSLLGINLVQYVVALPVMACSFYSFLFCYRIFKEVVGVEPADAALLTASYFSFAYAMLSVIVPDHFTISMFLLLLSLYIAGRCMAKDRCLTWWQGALLFVLTAGVTLSNGVKTFIVGLFTNGRRFFSLRYLLLAVLLPAALLWSFSKWEYRTYVWPKEHARQVEKVRKAELEKARIAAMTPAEQEKARARKAHRQAVLRKQAAKSGTPMKKVGFLSWTDISTSRVHTAYENLFGESVQFHQREFLGDTLVFRPVFVPYDWTFSYVVEAVIVWLFVMGIWAGRRSRFLWMCLTCFAFDMSIHLILGFGINEVHIMAPHWLFVMPIAVAFLFKAVRGRWRWALRGLTACLTLYLLLYNGIQLVSFLLTPIRATV